MAIDRNPSDVTQPAEQIQQNPFIKGESLFKSIPRSINDVRAEEVTVEESSAVTQVLIEILNWFFSNNGKHRDLLLSECSFADAYATDPSTANTKQQLITIQPVATYQVRRNPSIVVVVGSPVTTKTGVGIAIEGSSIASMSNNQFKRSYNTYSVQITASSSSQQTTNKIARLLGDIFNLHIPQYYQSVVINDMAKSQIIFPQEYGQPEFLNKDLQEGANVERVWSYQLSFKAEYESLRTIQGVGNLTVDNKKGSLILKHDLPEIVKMGRQYVITVKSNTVGVKLYTTNPNIFDLNKLSGPFGTGSGDYIYRGQALRTGSFKLYVQDMAETNKVESSHTVDF